MKTLAMLLNVGAITIAVGLAAPLAAQAVRETVTLNQIDPVVLATGWRASVILGAKVHNDAGDEIGTLEDLIITSAETVPYAIVSVGGFLGMNAHHVAVPASALGLVGEKLTLHGATKDSLKALPNFTFES